MSSLLSFDRNFLSLAGVTLALSGILTLQGADSGTRPLRLQESFVLQHLKANPISNPPKTAAQETVARMYLEDGFKAELVLAEPDLQQPIAFTFDERGRLWVAEAYSYPQKRPKGEGQDKIVIFEDRDGDGTYETRKVFAEGLNLVSGLEVGYGGVWVGAAPELLFIPDRDKDDHPDSEPQVLLDGFGYQDTHETLNNLTWGPDGWLYGNQGVFNYAQIGKPGAPVEQRVEMRAGVWRYHPVRHQFEVFAHGGSNQWGIDFDEHGQCFITHCRSYYGKGPTTHVIQGGHFWNQANQNYAPFISANAPEDYPFFRNYLLSAARYDHGEGGAGAPGTTKIYGGHAHVGTMIYLGDNWPDSYRGHLFTHNLHGQQMNHQVSERLGSGFNVTHSGKDFFYCEDPSYVAVNLKYGPDGAAYMIDWCDLQHCHNPNTEKWDRTNGRMYRIQYQATYHPRSVNLATKSDVELTALLLHHNDWYVRMATRLLHERAVAGTVDSHAKEALLDLVQKNSDPTRRLRGLWALHAIDADNEEVVSRMLTDADEYVRAWAIQLLTENRQPSPDLSRRFLELAQKDASPVVRLYLASAIQRVSENLAWDLIQALAQHLEDREDRNLPLMIWYGLALRMPQQIDRAFEIAEKTRIPVLADYVYWYAAKLNENGLSKVLALFPQLPEERQKSVLAGLALALHDRPHIAMPSAWAGIAGKLYGSSDRKVRHQAEELAGIFGDVSAFPRLRQSLGNAGADIAERKHAFNVLSRAQDHESLPVFLNLLDDAKFRMAAIPLLVRFDSPQIAEALLSRYSQFATSEKTVTLNAMTGRVSLALPLLVAVSDGKINRGDLTAYHIRQLSQLNDPEVNRRLAEKWGKVSFGAGEKQSQIAQLQKTFDQAPLWAYSETEGKRHFQTLCASCHRIKEEGNRIGPELTGAGANGIRYFLENVIDPNAVIGQDYQMTVISLRNGDVVSGIVENETAAAVTVRTAADRVVVAKSDIAQRKLSELSMMPEGLLDTLKEREKIELLKFLTEN